MSAAWNIIRKSIEFIDILLKPVGWLTAIFIFVANFWADLPNTYVFRTVEKIQSLLLPESRIIDEAHLYSYYELGEGRTLTQEGRLQPYGNREKPFYEDIRIGDEFFAASTVRIRAEPTSSGEIVGRLAKGDCARVVAADNPLQPSQLGNAVTGGWLRITQCTSGFVGEGGF